MKQYQFFPQQNNRCLASCLQSLLASRGLKIPSQEEISRNFSQVKGGFDVDEDALNRFLQAYGLRARFESPFTSFVEPDMLIKSFPQSSDILVAYDYLMLTHKGSGAGHLSILVDFREGQDREVYLHDNLAQKVEQVSLPDLINSMRTFRNCGFYLIRQTI